MLLRQCTNSPDEAVKLAAAEHEHELTCQAKLNHQRVFSLAFIPNLLQGGFGWPKHGVGEIRLQLAAHMRGILLSSRQLHFYPLCGAQEFKGNRFPAKGEVAQKLRNRLSPYIQFGRQGSLEFRERPQTKRLWFWLFFRFTNDRWGWLLGADCLAQFTDEGTQERWLAAVINDGRIRQIVAVKGDERGFGRHWFGKDLPAASA